MDEILYLEPDEEITSVIDKLKKTNAESVGLVIPRNSALIHSIVNLKLLKKEATAQKKAIALVTSDKIGKNIASQVGLQVYEDVHAKRPASTIGMPELPKGDEVIEVDMSAGPEPPSKATMQATGSPRIKHYTLTANNDTPTDEPTVTERMPASDYVSASTHAAHISRPIKEIDEPKYVGTSKKSPASGSGKGMIIFVSLFIVTVLASLTFLPQTGIDLTVSAESFEKAIPLTIDKNAHSIDTINAIIPGQLLESSNNDAKQVAASGKKDVGTKAKGSVTISNSWDSNPIKLASGTVLTANTGDKTFTLDNDTTIPGVTLTLKEGQLVTTPGTGNAKLTATDPGDSFNIAAGSFTIGGLSGAQQLKIIGQSSQAFSGGQTKTVTVITQDDINAARDALVQELNNAALEQLKKEAKGQKLINDAVLNEVVSSETNPKSVGSETENFDISVKVKHQAIVFDTKTVQTLVMSALKTEVPAGKELIANADDQFTIDVVGNDYAKGTLHLQSRIKTRIGTRIDVNQIKQGLSGKNESAIRTKLLTIQNVKQINLYKFPRWWWQDTSFAPWSTHLKVIYE